MGCIFFPGISWYCISSYSCNSTALHLQQLLRVQKANTDMPSCPGPQSPFSPGCNNPDYNRDYEFGTKNLKL